MNIPLPDGNDIYSLGFDKSLSREIPNDATGVVYDSINDTQNTASLLSGGSLTLKTLSVGGLVKQVAPGDDLQAAIDTVNREGGGTVQLLATTYRPTKHIYMRPKVSLNGAGRDATVLDFNGTVYGIVCDGTPSGFLNWGISNLTVTNSNAAAGVDIIEGYFFVLENVTVSHCSQYGIRVRLSSNFLMFNTVADYNTGAGFLFKVEVTDGLVGNFSLVNCVASNGSSHGFLLDSDAGVSYRIYNFSLINCLAEVNQGTGFYFNASTAVRMDGRVTNCSSNSNLGSGFDVDADVVQLYFDGCIPDSNGVDGFNIDGQHCTLVGCRGNGSNGVLDFDVNDDYNVVIGASFYNGGVLGSTFMDFDPTKAVIVANNSNSGLKLDRSFVQAVNGSGGGIPTGAVVAYNPQTNDPEQVTTTTTNGSNKVFGMMLTDTSSGTMIANTQIGKVLTSGYTTQLYVRNGTASISVGDWLSTSSHAYYAKKAIAGDTVFAFALTAPTTSTATISALLVSPRLI